MTSYVKAGLLGFIVIVVSTLALAKSPKRCEKVKIPFCSELGYNTTIFPNNLDHDTQDEAMKDAGEFNSLVEAECSPDIAYFLCSLYAPMCTVINKALPPCRLLCESARSGCEGLMNTFGFKWPKRFECENFPRQGLCVGRNVTSSSQLKKPTKGKKKVSVHKIRQRKCAKESHLGKLCCKLGRRAAKKGYFCNLKKKAGSSNNRKTIKFRKLVLRKCSKQSACFRSCCEVFQRKRRNAKRNTKRKNGKE